MRSLLFVPGDSARKLEKALASGADALIVDLEDSVDVGAKDEARRITAEFLKAARAAPGRPVLYVRVNGLTTGLTDADLDGVMAAGPDGIMLPKTVGGADVSHLGAKLAVREAEFDLADGEHGRHRHRDRKRAAGFSRSAPLPAHRTALRASPGAERIFRPTSVRRRTRVDDGSYTEPYRLARSLTLLGATAAEVDAIDAVYTNFRDHEGLAAECRAARRDGFAAKMAIHPGAGRRSSTRPSRPPRKRSPGRGRSSRLSPKIPARALSASTARCSTGRTSSEPSAFSGGPEEGRTARHRGAEDRRPAPPSRRCRGAWR